MGPSIVYLTKAAYEALETKVASNLYICTDSHEAFKGEEVIQDVIVYAQVKPENPSVNKVYCINKNLFLWSGEEWIDVTQIIIDQVEIALDPSKMVTKAQLKDAVDGVKEDVPTISFDDLYAKVKTAGYAGTKATFVAQLAEVLNATDDIVINEQEDVPVASVDGVEYASVAEAIGAVADGGTITMERNAVLDEAVILSANDVTLDFNGKMIELDNNRFEVTGQNVVLKNLNVVNNVDIDTPSEVVEGIVVEQGASLTIEDSAIDSRTKEVLVANPGSELTLKNVVVDSSLDPDYAATRYDSKSLVIADNATLNIIGGEIIADTSSDGECGLYPISAWNGCTIVLGDAETHEGPTIIGNSAPIGSNNTAEAVDNIIIHGGNYKSLMRHPQWMGVIYAGDSANITIDGGTFDGGDYDIALPYVPATYNVNISGGTFNGGTVIKKDYKKGGSGPQEPDVIAISGGKFANVFEAEYLADGYGLCKRADGTYEVLPVDTEGVEFVVVKEVQTGEVETPEEPAEEENP